MSKQDQPGGVEAQLATACGQHRGQRARFDTRLIHRQIPRQEQESQRQHPQPQGELADGADPFARDEERLEEGEAVGAHLPEVATDRLDARDQPVRRLEGEVALITGGGTGGTSAAGSCAPLQVEKTLRTRSAKPEALTGPTTTRMQFAGTNAEA